MSGTCETHKISYEGDVCPEHLKEIDEVMDQIYRERDAAFVLSAIAVIILVVMSLL